MADEQGSLGSLGEATVSVRAVGAQLGRDFLRMRGEIMGNLDGLGKDAESLGRKVSVGLTLPIIAGMGLAAKSAIEFESTFADVRRTVEGSDKVLDSLALRFRQLATEIPVSTTELNKIGSAAGALGIKTENIESFTATIAKMAVVTELTSDAAADGMARIANVMKMPQEQFENLASSINLVAKNGASTAPEIVAMARNLTGAAAVVKMSTADVVGFAGALASVGIEAEAGGSAISRTIFSMANSVSEGGKKLNEFGRVAGMSGDQFAKSFKENATDAIIAFIQGLQKLHASGENIFGTLDGLELRDIRLQRALLNATAAGNLFNESIENARKGFQDTGQFQEDYRKKSETLDAQLKIARQTINEIGITLGTAMIPMMKDALTAAEPLVAIVKGMADGWAKLPEPLRLASVGLGLVAAGIGPVLYFGGQMAQTVVLIASNWKNFVALAPAVVNAFRGITVAAYATEAAVALLSGPIIALAAAVGILTAANYAYNVNAKYLKETADQAKILKYLVDELNITWKDSAEAVKVLDSYQAGLEGRMIEAKGATAAMAQAWQRGMVDGGQVAVSTVINLSGALGQQAKAAGAAGKATGSLSADFAAAKKEMAGFNAEQKKNIADGHAMGLTDEKVAENVKVSAAAVKLYVDALDKSKKARADFMKDSAELGKKTIDLEDTFQNFTKTAGTYTDMMQATRSEVSKLTAAKRAEIEAGKAYGDSEAEIAKNVKVSEQAVKLYLDTVQKHTAEMKKMWEENDRLNDKTIELKDTFTNFTTDAGTMQQILGAVRSEVEGLSEEQRKNIIAGNDMGRSVKEIAKSLGISEEAVKMFLDRLKETTTWQKGLQNLASAFSNLAQVAGGSFGGLAKTLGSMVSFANVGVQAGTQFVEGIKQSFGMGGVKKNLASGMVSIASAMVAGISGMMASTGTESRLQNVLGGALTGAGTGAAIGTGIAMAMSSGASTGAAAGVWGAAAGAIVGIMIGIFRGRGTRREMEKVGEEWGTDISFGLAKQIEGDAKNLFDGVEEAARAWNLKDVIKEQGGVRPDNMQQLLGPLRDVFVLTERGLLNTGQAAHILDENFASFADTVVNSGHVASAAFTEIIRLNAQMNIGSKAIHDFVEAQTGRAASGMSDMFADTVTNAQAMAEKLKEAKDNLQKLTDAERERANEATGKGNDRDPYDVSQAAGEIAAAQAKVNELQGQMNTLAQQSGDDFTDMGILALSAFNSARAAGLSYFEALQAVQPAIANLIALQDTLGLTADEGLNSLIVGARVSETAAGKAAAGINEVTLALSNIGPVSQETLDAVQRRLGETMTRVQAEVAKAGGSHRDALQQMAPALDSIIELAQQYGLKIDDNTQMLIDQAREHDLLGHKAKTDQDVMKEGFDGVIEAVQQLTASVRDGLTGAIRTVQGGFSGLESSGKRAAGTIADEFNNKATPAVENLDNAVYGATYGHSPGGMIDLTEHAYLASAAIGDLASHGVIAMGKLYNGIDALLTGMGLLDEKTKKLTLFTLKIPLTMQGAISPAVQGMIDSAEAELKKLKDLQSSTKDDDHIKQMEDELKAYDASIKEIGADTPLGRILEARRDAMAAELDSQKTYVEALQEQLKKQIEVLEKRIEDLKNIKNPWEGYPIQPGQPGGPQMLNQDQAVARINTVFRQYGGRDASTAEIQRMAQAYGYTGGPINAARLEEFLQAMVQEYFQQTYGDGTPLPEELPEHASGGIALSPSVGIFGERGAEALIPLDRMDEFTGGGKDFMEAMSGQVSALRQDMKSFMFEIRNSLTNAMRYNANGVSA
jgi:TP901 family phage tail tape measure protein